MKRFPIRFSILSALVALVLLSIWLLRPRPISSGSLALPDGTTVRILATTYGTNHLIGSPLVRRMPAPMQKVLGRLFGRFAVPRAVTITPKPALVVWLERITNNAVPPAGGDFEAFLSDASGFISGEAASLPGASGGWVSSPQLSFYAIPRRDRTITVNFFYTSPTGGWTYSPCGSLRLANPLYGTFPQWQPEPLPATRHAGDVEVILEKLSTGHDQGNRFGRLKNGDPAVEFGTNYVDGRNNTVCAIHLKSLTDTNQVWYVANEEVSDATGNRISNNRITMDVSGQGYFTFQPGLWTNESAWKLKCEIKRAKGFAPAEMFQFKGVPLGRVDSSNYFGWRTNVNGALVTLDYLIRRAPNTNSSWTPAQVSGARFIFTGLTNGLHFDLLTTRTDTGTNLECGSWSSDGCRRDYEFRSLPPEATGVDFTFAVQQSRWVEFTVKPEVGPAQIPYKQQGGK